MLQRRLAVPVLVSLTLIAALCGCGQETMPATPSGASQPAQSPSLTELPTRTGTITPTPSPSTTRTPSPTPTRTLTPTATLPPKAAVKGVYGYGQLQALSCEARSAADWARHFDITIHEMDFMARMPRSKSPEEGFVGSPKGAWGAIPPESYGVHAGPVAKVLQEYGAQAKAVRNMHFDELRAEITAGRPVMVWVTGHVTPGERSIYRLDGKKITVARYEHTVIVIGYDAKYIEILDGKIVYKRPVERFLASWAVLENMAIVWHGNLPARVTATPRRTITPRK